MVPPIPKGPVPHWNPPPTDISGETPSSSPFPLPHFFNPPVPPLATPPPFRIPPQYLLAQNSIETTPDIPLENPPDDFSPWPWVIGAGLVLAGAGAAYWRHRHSPKNQAEIARPSLSGVFQGAEAPVLETVLADFMGATSHIPRLQDIGLGGGTGVSEAPPPWERDFDDLLFDYFFSRATPGKLEAFRTNFLAGTMADTYLPGSQESRNPYEYVQELRQHLTLEEDRGDFLHRQFSSTDEKEMAWEMLLIFEDLLETHPTLKTGLQSHRLVFREDPPWTFREEALRANQEAYAGQRALFERQQMERRERAARKTAEAFELVYSGLSLPELRKRIPPEEWIIVYRGQGQGANSRLLAPNLRANRQTRDPLRHGADLLTPAQRREYFARRTPAEQEAFLSYPFQRYAVVTTSLPDFAGQFASENEGRVMTLEIPRALLVEAVDVMSLQHIVDPHYDLGRRRELFIPFEIPPTLVVRDPWLRLDEPIQRDPLLSLLEQEAARASRLDREMWQDLRRHAQETPFTSTDNYLSWLRQRLSPQEGMERLDLDMRQFSLRDRFPTPEARLLWLAREAHDLKPGIFRETGTPLNRLTRALRALRSVRNIVVGRGHGHPFEQRDRWERRDTLLRRAH